MKRSKLLLIVLPLIVGLGCRFWNPGIQSPYPTPDALQNDFGNAPSPYPTGLAQNGARTNDVSQFGLGLRGNAEPDARPNDDVDGVFVASGSGAVSVAMMVCNRTNNPQNVFLNLIVDRNVNGRWERLDEWVVQNEAIRLGRRECVVETARTTVALGHGWLRAMVSDAQVPAGPNGWDGTGSFARGEVEDAPFSSETPPATQTPWKPPKTPTHTPTPKWIPTLKVCAGTPVYDKPNGKLIGVVKQTREGIELSRSGAWVQIQIKNDIGWIRSSGLAVNGECPKPKPHPTATTRAPAPGGK